MPAPEKPAVIDADTLARVGRAIYGNEWQSPLARDLGVNDRHVRYMLSGDRAAHAGIVADLLRIVEERKEELHEVAKVLRKALR